MVKRKLPARLSRNALHYLPIFMPILVPYHYPLESWWRVPQKPLSCHFLGLHRIMNLWPWLLINLLIKLFSIIIFKWVLTIQVLLLNEILIKKLGVIHYNSRVPAFSYFFTVRSYPEIFVYKTFGSVLALFGSIVIIQKLRNSSLHCGRPFLESKRLENLELILDFLGLLVME